MYRIFARNLPHCFDSLEGTRISGCGIYLEKYLQKWKESEEGFPPRHSKALHDLDSGNSVTVIDLFGVLH